MFDGFQMNCFNALMLRLETKSLDLGFSLDGLWFGFNLGYFN